MDNLIVNLDLGYKLVPSFTPELVPDKLKSDLDLSELDFILMRRLSDCLNYYELSKSSLKYTTIKLSYLRSSLKLTKNMFHKTQGIESVVYRDLYRDYLSAYKNGSLLKNNVKESLNDTNIMIKFILSQIQNWDYDKLEKLIILVPSNSISKLLSFKEMSKFVKLNNVFLKDKK